MVCRAFGHQVGPEASKRNLDLAREHYKLCPSGILCSIKHTDTRAAEGPSHSTTPAGIISVCRNYTLTREETRGWDYNSHLP
ncbi:hypothetical protein NDU88_010803 [Pleurodeles waltl]|uniref:Uncharacterized protein n=1 Tax=Pleurodeles waltl TaxID=8319 RepID=A0AAV7PX46_PLEWA|nr:hypothetical protein NDU88_010803 [Pleurodeles waltl]